MKLSRKEIRKLNDELTPLVERGVGLLDMSRPQDTYQVPILPKLIANVPEGYGLTIIKPIPGVAYFVRDYDFGNGQIICNFSPDNEQLTEMHRRIGMDNADRINRNATVLTSAKLKEPEPQEMHIYKDPGK